MKPWNTQRVSMLSEHCDHSVLSGRRPTIDLSRQQPITGGSGEKIDILTPGGRKTLLMQGKNHTFEEQQGLPPANFGKKNNRTSSRVFKNRRNTTRVYNDASINVMLRRTAAGINTPKGIRADDAKEERASELEDSGLGTCLTSGMFDAAAELSGDTADGHPGVLAEPLNNNNTKHGFQPSTGVERMLLKRIETLEKTISSTTFTVESQRTTISYQEAQIRRLRDVSFLLRTSVADLTEALRVSYISLPSRLQELPPPDEALENSSHYESKTREEVIAELQETMPKAMSFWAFQNESREEKLRHINEEGHGHGHGNAKPGHNEGNGTSSGEDENDVVHDDAASAPDRLRVSAPTSCSTGSSTDASEHAACPVVGNAKKHGFTTSSPKQPTPPMPTTTTAKGKWNNRDKKCAGGEKEYNSAVVYGNSRTTSTCRSGARIKKRDRAKMFSSLSLRPSSEMSVKEPSRHDTGRHIPRDWDTSYSTFAEAVIREDHEELPANFYAADGSSIMSGVHGVHGAHFTSGSSRVTGVGMPGLQGSQSPMHGARACQHKINKVFDGQSSDLVRVILNSQFDRQLYRTVLTHLLGSKMQHKLQSKFQEMIMETIAVLTVSKNIGYHNDLMNFMPQWMQIVCDLTECERGTLFTYDDDTGELFSRVLTGSFKAPLRIQKGTGIAGHVFETGSPVIANNCYDDLRFNPMSDRRTSLRTRNILCVPILFGPRIVGVVELLNKNAHSRNGGASSGGAPEAAGGFGPTDLKLLETLTRAIAPGLTSPKVHKRLKANHIHEARMLKQAISGDKSKFMAPLVSEIMKCVSSILDTERCTLFLADNARQKLWAIVSQGLENIRIEIPNNQGIAGAVFTNNLCLNIPDCYADPRFNTAVDIESGFKTRSICCSPIIHVVSGKPIGVVQAINKIGGVFSKGDEKRLEQLCNMVSSILITSDSLEEMTVSAELNERIYQCLSVATIAVNSVGHCMKVNRDAADLFFLENSAQWAGKHVAELFGQTNPMVLQMWTQCVESRLEQTADCLAIYPFVGEAEGDLRSVRVIPFSDDDRIVGSVMTFTAVYKSL